MSLRYHFEISHFDIIKMSQIIDIIHYGKCYNLYETFSKNNKK